MRPDGRGRVAADAARETRTGSASAKCAREENNKAPEPLCLSRSRKDRGLVQALFAFWEGDGGGEA